MLCDDCKEKPASVHITKINNNQKVEKHLCEMCAQKSGEINFTADNKFFVQDLLKGMFNQGFTAVPQRQKTEVCPGCGMSYEDFSRLGKIGCSACYAAYADRLEPLLRRIHGTHSHTGKVPKRSGGKLAIKQKLKKLRQELEDYINREEYEQAAVIRDEIRSVEKELAE